MQVTQWLRRWRNWVPVPNEEGQIAFDRWVLLEANRLAVVGALLTAVFVTLTVVGTFWTFEMQVLLTETSTVQTVLNTLLSGMILLVSIVVSINSIVLSNEIKSIRGEENRIQGTMEFRQHLGELNESGANPSNPASFLDLMGRTIGERASALESEIERADEDVPPEIEEYVASISNMTDQLNRVEDTTGADFAVLWKGMEFDYGRYVDQSRSIVTTENMQSSEGIRERFEDLAEAFELFAIGKEYFKTLYYTQEVSKLSRTLLVVSLPAILFNATTILAIDSGLLPQVWLFGLPPLQSFVFTAFTVSLIPYLVLTSYMLRLATVAKYTAVGGVFSLR